MGGIIKAHTTSLIRTIETKLSGFSRPYRTQVVGVQYPAMNHWANARCPYGTRIMTPTYDTLIADS